MERGLLWALVGVVMWGTWAAGEAEAGEAPAGYVPNETLPPPAPPSEGWGLAQEEAIEVCKPAGEWAYLNRLRCADGSAPKWRRVGSVGSRHQVPADMSSEARFAQMDPERPVPEGEVDVHTIDLYDVMCPKQPTVQMYLDMYHCPQPDYMFGPKGFSVELVR
jgi:hypothetical protein